MDVDYCSNIDSIYNNVVHVLTQCANAHVPQHRKNFYKFWWDEQLKLLKDDSIQSNQLWKAAGKPRHGPLFDKRQKCRLAYRKRIREGQKLSLTSYTNDLNDALMQKNGHDFWKCWRSKFESSNVCQQVDGCVDSDKIADKFAQHFAKSYTCNDDARAADLKAEFLQQRINYCGTALTDASLFDCELVGNVIAELKRGKAAGLDNLSAEHLINSHPIVISLLTRLFNLMLLCGHVPSSFGRSYTIPIPKIKDCRTKAMTVDDFRGIAISCILSKVFEHCIIARFSKYLQSADNQFGFKKGLGCSHAIYTVRKYVELFNNGGSTVNLCAIDISKAYDKTNHFALFVKLMQRNIPSELLSVLEDWFSNCWTCVKWGASTSQFFKIDYGVRQGSVLSPYLFAVYIDGIAGRFSIGHGFLIVLYADDILILAPSVTDLQELFSECEARLLALDMSINAKKSCCLRVGPRCESVCADIVTSSGLVLPWVNEIRYLGVFIMKSRAFKCSLDFAKRAFYRSLNAVFGKIGRIASEEVVLELVCKKCLPILLYGLEACPLNMSDRKSLDFPVIRFLMKLFKTVNMDIITNCRSYFAFALPSELLAVRTDKFVARYCNCDNLFCSRDKTFA